MQKPCPLSKAHNLSTFDCQVEPLNNYLTQHALPSQGAHGAVTYVAIDGEQVAGYYTLVFGSITHDEAPDRVKKGLQRPNVPILLLARLAVDNKYKGNGLGRSLLQDALQWAVKASEIAGLRAVVVHAKDKAAKTFYEHYNFSAMPLDEFHLCLLMKDLKAQLGQSLLNPTPS